MRRQPRESDPSGHSGSCTGLVALIGLLVDTSTSYVRKSVKSRRILTQFPLSVVKMG